MSLEDHQTGRPIISPYISIGLEGELVHRYAINTETFRDCQDWLILQRTLKRDVDSERYKEEVSQERTVSVFAVIGDYNTGPEHLGSNYGINRTVSWKRLPIAEQQIGTIPLAILREKIPKVYKSIKKDLESLTKSR